MKKTSSSTSHKKYDSAVCHIITQTNEDETAVAVCGYSLVSLDMSSISISNSLVDMFEYCINNRIRTIFFHDFTLEGDFIINFFLDLGLEHVDSCNRDKTFSIFKANNKLYSITARFNGCRFSIFGSRNILMSSVNDINRSWACGYDNDFEDHVICLKHDQNVTNNMLNINTEYCKVLCKALNAWQKKNNGTSYTVGAEALKQWKSSYINWSDDFANKIDVETENKLRQAYRGGFTWLKPSYKNILIKDGIVIDANAMYSSIMTQCEMPYGTPIHDTNATCAGYPYSIYKVRMTAELKQNSIPCLSCSNTDKYSASMNKTEYLNTLDDEIVYLTNFDLSLADRCYDILECDLLEAWHFKTKIGCFDSYLKFWYDQKINTDGAVHELSKLMYEALSGKFGSRRDGYKCIPKLMDDGSITYEPIKLNSDTSKLFNYIPVIIFTTSLARKKIIELGLKYYDRLVYIDTDSVHLIGTELPDVEIGKNLGQYKVEALFTRAKYIGLKNYIHDEVDVNGNIKTVTKMAGAPKNVQRQLNWDNFHTGTVVDGKPYIVRLIGGSIRKNSKYTLLMQ